MRLDLLNSPRPLPAIWALCFAVLWAHESCGASESDLVRRNPQANTDPNQCSAGPYTAPNGLEFSVQCDTNSAGNDLYSVNSTDIYDCMDQCSSAEVPCYGAVWDNALFFACYLKNSSITDASTFGESKVFFGLANTEQLEPLPTACPYTNGSVHATSEGYRFRLHCGLDLPGFDIAGPVHTDTLAECLESCNSVQPLCWGVAWNPDLRHGFNNCYFKGSNDVANLDVPPFVVHTALALDNQTQDFNSSCNDGSTYTSNDKEFTFHCGQDRPGSDLYANHTNSLGACVELCANYFNSSTGACQAVAFNPDSQKSWSNCYLKTAAATPVADGDFDVAILTNGRAGGDSSNGTDSGNGTNGSNSTTDGNGDNSTQNSSSKAWIAGAVVGAVAAIALIAGAFFWLRRRKSKGPGAGTYVPAGQRDSPENKGYQMNHVHPTPAYDQVDHKYQPEARSPPVEADGGQTRQELPTSPGLPYELDASNPTTHHIQG